MHGAQTVVIKDKVYCGGGIAHDASDKLRVFCYSPAIDAWDALPSCDMRYFGLSHRRGKLVTVGGIKESDGTVTNEVNEFDEATHSWKQSIRPMPTARHSPTILSHHSALIVAGGFTTDRLKRFCTRAMARRGEKGQITLANYVLFRCSVNH